MSEEQLQSLIELFKRRRRTSEIKMIDGDRAHHKGRVSALTGVIDALEKIQTQNRETKQ